MISGINKYTGNWESDDGFQLDIKITSNTSAKVSFYNSTFKAIKRSYYNDNPTINMHASYDDYLNELRVDLWKKGKGFELHLAYEREYALDKFKRDALIPALSQYDKDSFLENYDGMFGILKHFVRVEDKNDNIITAHFNAPY